MLAGRWTSAGPVREARDHWSTAGTVRCEPLMPETTAVNCLRALRAADYVAAHRFELGQAYQLWRYGWRPCDACDQHPLCRLGRWVVGDGVAFVSAVTGRDLHAPTDALLLADHTRKGSFFETYDDAAQGASIALQLHFTTASWPAHWGGHIARCPSDAQGPTEGWSPSWNALDIIDLERGSTLRRMALMTRHVEGFTIAFWLHRT